MARYVHGSAAGVAVGPVDGTRSVLHRYEIVGDVLVRRRVADRRPFVDGDVRLIDVLINEDEAGRSINVVRGIVVNERDLARGASPSCALTWREFAVGADLLLAIGEDLRVGPSEGPAASAPNSESNPESYPAPNRPRRPALRLVALDGRRLDGPGDAEG